MSQPAMIDVTVLVRIRGRGRLIPDGAERRRRPRLSADGTSDECSFHSFPAVRKEAVDPSGRTASAILVSGLDG